MEQANEYPAVFHPHYNPACGRRLAQLALLNELLANPTRFSTGHPDQFQDGPLIKSLKYSEQYTRPGIACGAQLDIRDATSGLPVRFSILTAELASRGHATNITTDLRCNYVACSQQQRPVLR